MPLQLVSPAPDTWSTYQQSLKDFLGSDAEYKLPDTWSTYEQSVLDFLGRHDAEFKLYHLPVGTLDLVALANGATLRDVVPSGGRFFATWGHGTAASCEMTNPTRNGLAAFRNFVQGDAVAAAFARITEAEGLATVQTGSFELNFLSIPGIFLEALHLRCSADGIDLVLPVLSGYSQLPTDAVLDADAFLAQARAIATARLAQPTSSDLSS